MLLLLIALAGAVYFLTWTETGLQTLLAISAGRFGQYVQIESAHGRLAGPLHLSGLRIDYAAGQTRIGTLALAWSPKALLSGTFRIDELEVDDLQVIQSAAAPTDTETGPFTLDVQLPVNISVGSATLRGVQVREEDRPLFVAERIELSAFTRTDQLVIETLSLATAELRANASGTLGLTPQSRSVLSVDWELHLPDAEDLTSRGQLQIDGILDDYAYNAELTLQSRQIPAGTWQLAGKGTPRGLSIDTLQGKTLDGAISGQARLEWTPSLQWTASLDSNDINPGAHWPDWPGQLSGGLGSQGEYADGKARFSAQLSRLRGQLRGYPVSGQADVNVDDSDIAIHALQLNSGNNRLTASGSVGDKLALDWQLDARELAAVMPDWGGSATMTGKIRGSRQQPDLQTQFAVQSLQGPYITLESMQGDIKLKLSEQAQQVIQLQARNAVVDGNAIEAVDLSVQGLLNRHHIDLSANAKASSLQLAMDGGWSGQRWQGAASTASWETPQTGRWALAQPVALTLAANDIRLADACWLQNDASLCVDVAGDPQQAWRADAQVTQLSLDRIEQLMTSPLHWSSRLDAKLTASGMAGKLSKASLQATVGSGQLVYDDPDAPIEEQIQGGTLSATLDDSGVTADLHFALNERDYLDSHLALPGYQPQDTRWQQQPLSFAAKGQLQELATLRYLIEDVATFKGHIDIDITGKGTLGRPVFAGGASVTDSTIGINKLGIELQQLQLAVRSETDGLSMNGSCRSGQGELSVDGKLQFEDIAHWSANLKLQGKDFEAVHIPEAVVLVSPDIETQFRPRELRLQGELHVPKARFKPKQLPSDVTVSRDVVIVDPEQEAPPAERWLVYSRLRLSLGKEVWLDGFGVKGYLSGNVDLKDEPQRVTTARGKLAIEEGSYKFLGRELTISKGQLLFSDGPVDNPGLDFDAERHVREVIAGIRVRGTLKDPDISLYSDPAMSDTDIVSYISFGVPASESTQAGGSASEQAALAGGNVLLGGVGESVGLEELQFEADETGEQTSLVLGTYLSPQLFVRYSQGLYDTANQFEAIYKITRNWLIRTQTSPEQSGADVFYSFER